MTDLDKLELVHCAIQEVIKLNRYLDDDMDGELSNALELVEQLREPLLQKLGDPR